MATIGRYRWSGLGIEGDCICTAPRLRPSRSQSMTQQVAVGHVLMTHCPTARGSNPDGLPERATPQIYRPAMAGGGIPQDSPFYLYLNEEFLTFLSVAKQQLYLQDLVDAGCFTATKVTELYPGGPEFIDSLYRSAFQSCCHCRSCFPMAVITWSDQATFDCVVQPTSWQSSRSHSETGCPIQPSCC